MGLDRDSIEARLSKLHEILDVLRDYYTLTFDAFTADPLREWGVEKALITLSAIVFDVANHILASHFVAYPKTYEEGLDLLRQKRVISEELHQEIKGLGGFRNILVHGYMEVEAVKVFGNFQKAPIVFPRFAHEILVWLDSVETD